MKHKARHLQILELSKKDLEDKQSKIKNRINQIQDARYDEAREKANLYAKSMGKEPPNKLSYQNTDRK